ncbi:MAG: tetratricopeptide repeat protein [Ruminococcaceae bacterium]|nr:tetratricopeptide repeat protein [Oscillospiraceae bacterium]
MFGLFKKNKKGKDEKSKAYCFNDMQEFIMFAAVQKQKNRTEDFEWMKSEEYDKFWKNGYSLFEQKQYDKAIANYEKCLSMNPISLYVRFEIAECYIQLGDYASALKYLEKNIEFLIEDKYIAQFYRRIGFINIEKENYICAVACYVYSNEFEKHPSVMQELMYIAQQCGKMPEINDVKEVLRKNNIHIFQPKAREFPTKVSNEHQQ